jgi:serine/threonine protein kinase
VIGRAISHYRVLSSLGSGGMGVVFLAEDERLGRQVALKFLPPESVASRQALDRFRVEARAASSLSHPGICAIFDIGEDEGTPYIVMEVLKGESLRDRINRGPMRVVDVLDIGIQLADALDAAHAQGIVHRDIKPSNIFVGEKNRTKILDFGLAKLTQPSGASEAATRALNASTHHDLTMPGSAVGTVSYMSPEQARGEEVDTRTDLFSLGVVLYEMTTGTQAFGGSTQAIVFDAILNRTPLPVTHVNPLIPPRLEALISTALEKERDLRQQHASDFEAELKRIRRDLESGSLASVSRTVVLPPAERKSDVAAPFKPGRSTWWIWTTTTAFVLIAAAGIGLYYRGASQPSQMAMIAPQADVQTETISPAPATPPDPVDQPAAEPAATSPAPQPQDVAPPPPRSAARPQPQPPDRAAEAKPQASQPSVTPPPPVTTPPPRPTPEGPPPSIVAIPAAPPTGALAPPPTIDPPKPAAPPATAPAPAPNPPAPETPAAQPPPRPAASAPPVQPTTPPPAPVESDEALIRGVVRTYERAIETQSVDLYRSVRPGLSAEDEKVLRTSFSQIDSQQVDIVIEELRINGRTATVRLSRRDTFTSRGTRQTNSSRQTLRFEKAAAGWIIIDIIGR